MSNNNDWPSPLTILAAGVGAAIVLIVLGYVLYYLIPVIGTAIGLCVAVSTTGLATAGILSTWIVPTATVSVAIVGVTAAGVALKKVSDSVGEKPYEWGLPLLGVFAGFASTLAKDTGLDSNASKWLFGGITALLIVVAGACYKRPSWKWKTVAVLFYVLPPLVLLGWSTLSTKQSSVGAAFSSVSLWTWLGIACIVIVGALIGMLSRLEARKEQATR